MEGRMEGRNTASSPFPSHPIRSYTMAMCQTIFEFNLTEIVSMIMSQSQQQTERETRPHDMRHMPQSHRNKGNGPARPGPVVFSSATNTTPNSSARSIDDHRSPITDRQSANLWIYESANRQLLIGFTVMSPLGSRWVQIQAVNLLIIFGIVTISRYKKL